MLKWCDFLETSFWSIRLLIQELALSFRQFKTVSIGATMTKMTNQFVPCFARQVTIFFFGKNFILFGFRISCRRSTKEKVFLQIRFEFELFAICESYEILSTEKVELLTGACEWSPAERSFCRPNPTCRPIEAPENGRVDCPIESLCVVSCDQAPDMTFWERTFVYQFRANRKRKTKKFYPIQGYEMDHGLIEKTLTCDCDINDYQCTWNKPVPKCKRKWIPREC